MTFISLVVAGAVLFSTGAILSYSCKPLPEKERIAKFYEELELQKKKEALMPICNADINLFGILDY